LALKSNDKRRTGEDHPKQTQKNGAEKTGGKRKDTIRKGKMEAKKGNSPIKKEQGEVDSGGGNNRKRDANKNNPLDP